MKKILLLILVVVMLFTFVACGGDSEDVATEDGATDDVTTEESTNNDENNAIVQVKVDEAEALLLEMTNWYKDNGFLEGESATTIQPVVDNLTTQLDEIKGSHQEILDAGGYVDEQVVLMNEALDLLIGKYKEAMAELDAIMKSEEDGTGIGALTEKYNVVAGLTNQVLTKAKENGWENDEALNTTVVQVLQLLELAETDLGNPDVMNETYMNELFVLFDDLIPMLEETVIKVSEPYVSN